MTKFIGGVTYRETDNGTWNIFVPDSYENGDLIAWCVLTYFCTDRPPSTEDRNGVFHLDLELEWETLHSFVRQPR